MVNFFAVAHTYLATLLKGIPYPVPSIIVRQMLAMVLLVFLFVVSRLMHQVGTTFPSADNGRQKR